MTAFRWFYYGSTPQERIDQLATKSFVKDHDNIYRGLFPLIPGKLSHKEGYDMGTLDFGPETEQVAIRISCITLQFHEFFFVSRRRRRGRPIRSMGIPPGWRFRVTPAARPRRTRSTR